MKRAIYFRLILLSFISILTCSILAVLLYNLMPQVPAILLAVAVALILSFILAGRFSRLVFHPLERIVDALTVRDYNSLSRYKSPYYEIDQMIRSIQRLIQKIADSNEELKEEQEKLDYILSNMAEGFVLLDNKKNILLCNDSARDFFSLRQEWDLKTIYHLSRNRSLLNAVQLAIENGQSSMFDLKLKEDLIANFYISPSKTSENSYGATMLIIDMTAEKQLEQQKRDFFSNASHELKTPITSILGFAQMINHDLVTGEKEKSELISRIEIEADRMSKLINDILTISRLESDRSEKELEFFSLDEIVEEAINSVSPMKDNTTIQIQKELQEIKVQANSHQIYELCVNLIENAVKYNRPGGTVHISLKEEGGEAVFSVADTGIGIAPEYQGRVFERFFRVDFGREKKVGGTGLGLSIVKHIATIYGGRILLESSVGLGTKITVALPIIK